MPKDDKDNLTDTGTRTWVNTPMEKDQVEKLDTMVAENGSDRSKFIRLLVEQEWERRQMVKNTINKLKKKGAWPH